MLKFKRVQLEKDWTSMFVWKGCQAKASPLWKNTAPQLRFANLHRNKPRDGTLGLVYLHLRENVLTLHKKTSLHAKLMDFWNGRATLFCSQPHAYISKFESFRTNSLIQSPYYLHSICMLPCCHFSVWGNTFSPRWSREGSDDVKEKPAIQRQKEKKGESRTA